MWDRIGELLVYCGRNSGVVQVHISSEKRIDNMYSLLGSRLCIVQAFNDTIKTVHTPAVYT